MLLRELHERADPHHEHDYPAGDEHQRGDRHTRRGTACGSAPRHQARRDSDEHCHHPRTDVPPSCDPLAHGHLLIPPRKLLPLLVERGCARRYLSTNRIGRGGRIRTLGPRFWSFWPAPYQRRLRSAASSSGRLRSTDVGRVAYTVGFTCEGHPCLTRCASGVSLSSALSARAPCVA